MNDEELYRRTTEALKQVEQWRAEEFKNDGRVARYLIEVVTALRDSVDYVEKEYELEDELVVHEKDEYDFDF